MGVVIVTGVPGVGKSTVMKAARDYGCLLYTSDAADE